MKTKLAVSTIILVLLAAAAYVARDDLGPLLKRMTSGEGSYFTEMALPETELLQLYDMGIVDANGDGFLDIYTSAHNYRQNLWLSDGQGGYQDHLTAWGMDQHLTLPGVEQSERAPLKDKAGLYIYWYSDLLNLEAHKTDNLPPLKGKLQFYNKVEIISNEGFQVSSRVSEEAAVPVTQLDFSSAGSGRLSLYVSTRGTPIRFDLDAPWARDQVFVGTQAVVPTNSSLELGRAYDAHGHAEQACAHCQTFDIALRDRHGMAWSDYNNDGQMGVYITRGALGGTLRKFPDAVRERVNDEMFVSRGPGQFTDRFQQLGFSKNDCSGRHVRWVDFDRDDRLDLYINCQDRGNVAGGYPKQFYQQQANGQFIEIAAKVGLDIPNHQLIDFAWFDADGDGDQDMLTHEDQGYFLYVQQDDHRFERRFIHRSEFERADVKGLKGNTDDYWQFDGKLSLADFDQDGDLDVFVAAKKGNALLINAGGGKFEAVSLAKFGLPTASVAAAWVDYDNDGMLDLHTVPEGIFRQVKPGSFAPTGLFALSSNKYQAAFIHWFDQDNDGKLDVVMALQENASLWRWWEKPFRQKDVKGKDDRFRWKLLAYRNVGATGHWLQVNLEGAPGNREAIGTKVTLVTPTGRHSSVVGSNESSYFSQGHYRLYFGLATMDRPARIEIGWPNQEKKTITTEQLDRIMEIPNR